MKFFTEVNTFYPLPSLKFIYDFSETEEGRLKYFDIELVWLKWGISIDIINEEWGGRAIEIKGRASSILAIYMLGKLSFPIYIKLFINNKTN